MPADDLAAAQKRFVANLRSARESAGLTQEELAWASDLHQTAVNRIERGLRSPNLETIIKLAHALEIPAAELLEGV